MMSDSTRTKMLKDAPVDEDMGPVKRMVKKGATKVSEMLDRMGMTQEKEYQGKSKEELEVKKAKGGAIKYKNGGVTRADGICKKGHTKGRMV
jgi:hypothetical protein